MVQKVASNKGVQAKIYVIYYIRCCVINFIYGLLDRNETGHAALNSLAIINELTSSHCLLLDKKKKSPTQRS